MSAENGASIKKWGLRAAGAVLGIGGVVAGAVAVDSVVTVDYFDATIEGIGAVTLELGAASCIVAPLASERKKVEFVAVQESLAERGNLLGQLEEALVERREITRQIIENLPK